MAKCTKCRNGLMERSIKPEHTEDLGGIVVKLNNAVIERRCKCGAVETAIPDMQGLVRAVAFARALDPIRLGGAEVRFMRRALDMTQKKFAEVMELVPETVSRWENNVPGHGGASEKLLRHNVCALLHKTVPASAYDPVTIANMKFELGTIEMMEMGRVRVVHGTEQEDAWSERAVA